MPKFLTSAALLGAYVATSSAGLLLIKRMLVRMAGQKPDIFSPSPDLAFLALGCGLYIASFGLWLKVLSRLPLSTAYPIAIGLTLAFSTAGATMLLGERLPMLKILKNTVGK